MIAIVTPYAPGRDASLAATRLADFLTARSHRVQLLARGGLGAQVHPFWDGEVRRYYGSRDLRSARRIVLFGSAAGDLPAPDSRWLCVPDWPGASSAVRRRILKYSTIVFPSCDMRAKAGLTLTARYTVWSSGLTPGLCGVTTGPLAIWATPGRGRRLTEPRFLRTVWPRLKAGRSLRLLRFAPRAREDRSTVRAMVESFPGLVQDVAVAPGPYGIAAALAGCSGLAVYGGRPSLGMAAAYAAACGLPFYGPDLPPYTDFIGHYAAGRLSPAGEPLVVRAPQPVAADGAARLDADFVDGWSLDWD